jgi:enediyne biosynthesis protein E4
MAAARRGEQGDAPSRGPRWALALAVLLAACSHEAPLPPAGGDASGSSGAGSLGTSTGGPAADESSGGPGRPPPGSTGPASTDAPGPDAGDATGELPVPPVVEPSFIDVAADAGLDHDHGEWNTAPNCLIDQIGPATNGFCLPERMTAGAAAADYDGDGWVDLVVSRTHGRPLLYRNQGDGTFEEVGLAAGILDHVWGTSGLAWADFDNDDDQDLYVVTLGDYRYYLYVNDGTGHFTEEGLARGAALETPNVHAGMAVAVGDYDLDGWTDLYVGEWRTIAGLGDVPSHSRLLRNRGAEAPGHFDDVTVEAGVSVEDVWVGQTVLGGVYSFSPSFGDLDGDGYPDLGVVSDFRCSRLFWNQGDGTFVDGTVAAGAGQDKNGMGSAFGDYDGDGDLDWYVTSISDPEGPPENRLYRNDGDRQLTEVADALGVGRGGWGWGTSFFDPDNDGDLDLLATSGYYFSDHLAEGTHLWLNQLDPLGAGGGSGFGPDAAMAAGIDAVVQGRGVLIVDYDRDGDLDVYLAQNFLPPILWENLTGNLHDHLRVRAVGTQSNRDGLGVRVTVRVTHDGPALVHEIGGSMAHFMGQPEKVAHFGLGFGQAPVAEVRLYWPASGQEQVLTNVPRNSELVVVEP